MLFAFAISRDMAADNPCRSVKFLKVDSDGWSQWPDGELSHFAEKSQGAARIGFYLALYTGQRRGDIVSMRWSAIEDGGIWVQQEKTRTTSKNRFSLWIPIHPVLSAELEAVPCKGLTIIQRLDGSPYTSDGFATIWNREQHRLECNGLPFHGLRKNATSRLFEAGCTPQQVQAITGHATLQMVEHYGKGSNQKLLARQAMDKVIAGDKK